MPSSPNDHESHSRANATCVSSDFTAEELLAFQTVSHRLNISLSDMLRLAEIRQRNPDAHFPLLDGPVAEPASPIGSPVRTVESRPSDISDDTATKSISHTATAEDGEHVVIQPEVFNAADKDLAEEQHQGAVLEGANGASQISAADLSNSLLLEYFEPVDATFTATGEQTIGAQFLSSGGEAARVDPALIEQSAWQIYDTGILDLHQNAVLQPFLSPATSARVAPSLQSPAFAPIPNAQFTNYLVNDIPIASDNGATATGVGARFVEGVDFSDWENWEVENEASSQITAAANEQAALLPNQQSLTAPIDLGSATSEPIASSGAELSVSEIHDIQRHRTEKRRQLRPTVSSGPKSGVQKKRHNLDAVAAVVVGAGHLRACAGCWIQHKKCEPSKYSEACYLCATKKSLSAPPCYRFLRIVEVALFRTQTDVTLWNKAKLGLDDCIISRVKSWIPSDTDTLEMTQGYGTILRLRARKFDSSTIDLHTLSEAERHTYENPWGLTDISQAEVDIRNFIYESVGPYISSKAKADDDISRGFFAEILEHTQSKATAPKIQKLLQSVVLLWTAARMIEGGWYFCGSNTFDVPPIDGKCYLHDAPFLDYEFAGIVVDRILMPWRSLVLKYLSELSYANKKENWFALLLANFVLQHTFGLLMRQQRALAAELKKPVRYTSMPLINSIHVGSRTLLGHFHHLIKGAKPFEDDWTSQEVNRSIAKMADLNERQVQFLRRLAPKIKEKMSIFRELIQSQEYESDHWFTGQLFLSDWVAPPLLQESPPA